MGRPQSTNGRELKHKLCFRSSRFERTSAIPSACRSRYLDTNQMSVAPLQEVANRFEFVPSPSLCLVQE